MSKTRTRKRYPSEAVRTINGIIFNSDQEAELPQYNSSVQKKDYVKGILNTYYSKNFQMDHNQESDRPKRDFDKVIHDNLTHLMTSLSYTNDENRFLDKVIHWYKTKSGESSLNNSKALHKLRKPLRTDRNSTEMNELNGNFFSKRYKSPEHFGRKGKVAHISHHNSGDFLIPNTERNFNARENHKIGTTRVKDLAGRLKPGRPIGGEKVSQKSLNTPSRKPTSSSMCSSIYIDKKETIMKLKKDIEERQKKAQKKLEKIRARLQDPDKLYMTIKKFNSKKKLQTRKISGGLSLQEMQERNHRFYENLRKGVRNPWISIEFKQEKKRSPQPSPRVVKTSEIFHRGRSQETVHNREYANPGQTLEIKNQPKGVNIKMENTRSTPAIVKKTNKMMKLRSTYVIEDTDSLEMDPQKSPEIRVKKMYSNEIKSIPPKKFFKRQVLFNDSAESPSLNQSSSHIKEEANEEETPGNDRFKLITPIKMNKPRKSFKPPSVSHFDANFNFIS
ncbi:unnamed protein product [Moneuplotes crassus]|uniref:Uncharacterized protein n=1 Tax=Euplotes crassus TaxID=5936 RepID=A0AAD1UDL1_EUPCR|nr:unnamed protein product [Moneuplotes crassus]